MAVVVERKHPGHEVLSLFPIPLETDSQVYYEEDLEELGLDRILEGLSEEAHRDILAQAWRLSRVQPELAFHFLLHYQDLLGHIGKEELTKWVNVVLEIYDAKGLNPAREFVLKGADHPHFVRFWGEGLAFEEVAGVLLNYLRGLGGEDLGIEIGNTHFTDLMKIYVPARIAFFGHRALNFALYKVMVTHKFAQVLLGTYDLRWDATGHAKGRRLKGGNGGGKSELSLFFQSHAESRLAHDLFLLADTVRIERWMADTLPGLYRDLNRLKEAWAKRGSSFFPSSPKERAVQGMMEGWTALPGESSHGGVSNSSVEPLLQVLLAAGEPGSGIREIAGITEVLYTEIEQLSGKYRGVEFLSYMGELRPEEAERGRQSKRESNRTKFREALSKLVREIPHCDEIRIELPGTERKRTVKEGISQRQEVPQYLLVNGNPVPAPEGLQKVIEKIYEDLGSIPASYLAITDEMSGHYFRSLCKVPEGTGYVLPKHGEGIYSLDEWDYRRQGYRRHWATLRESEASAGGLAFVGATLTRYRGMIQQIKRQFERIRLEQRILRRQRDGDDIDLDAAVEAFADWHAQSPPSERLFLKLRRDRRDIASAFLIDLSGSTSGWINEMARSALLILSEAVSILRDRFAIFGFSGRTRRRCELFRIKGIHEPYGDEIKRRIAALRPLEYTRLGAPIRRVTDILAQEEARTRLLITLTDGKPDDWDGYNGDYGIEDTRQALLEAKRRGIHPFCITIDKAEHAYLSYMYGPANYIFVDDLAQLPSKVPEIYRKLTT